LKQQGIETLSFLYGPDQKEKSVAPRLQAVVVDGDWMLLFVDMDSLHKEVLIPRCDKSPSECQTAAFAASIFKEFKFTRAFGRYMELLSGQLISSQSYSSSYPVSQPVDEDMVPQSEKKRALYCKPTSD
jgi:hypothetical protein